MRRLHATASELGVARWVAAAVLAAQVVLGVALAVYAVHAIAGWGTGPLFESWLYDGILVGAAALCIARAALVASHRRAWSFLGGGLACWSLSVVDLTLHPALSQHPFPTRADVLALAFYPAAYVSLVLLVRSRVRQFYASLWLDGVVGALALSAVVAGLVLPPLLTGSGGSASSVVADLAYPVADVLLGAFVLWVCSLTEWRPGRVLGVVSAGLALGAAADVTSLWWALSGHSTSQTALDWLWPASALTLAVGAWQAPRTAPAIRLSGLRPLLPPVAFGLTALGLLVYGRAHRLDAAGFALVCATLAGVIARMAMTFLENVRMVARSHADALTDPLTGLGNRRRLTADLQDAIDDAAAHRPYGLLIFDLDGFKGFNDSFGHPAGDALLARLGSALRTGVGEEAAAYRLGGDEFCVLARIGGRSLAAIAEASVAALTEHGDGYAVATSYGAVLLPSEAGDAVTALQVADDRLYASKGTRRRAPVLRDARDRAPSAAA
jgi:diguanylate cyclase (GGDEF)-like protein